MACCQAKKECKSPVDLGILALTIGGMTDTEQDTTDETIDSLAYVQRAIIAMTLEREQLRKRAKAIDDLFCRLTVDA